MASAWYALYTKRQEGKLYVSKLFHRQTLICHIASCEHTTKCSERQQTSRLHLLLTSLLTGGSWSVVQGVCQLHTLQEDQQFLLPSWTLSTANAKLSGKLAAVMHVAVILQDYLAHHTAIVLAKPCASILTPNMMRMKVYMIMRMKVLVRRNKGARENGE